MPKVKGAMQDMRRMIAPYLLQDTGRLLKPMPEDERTMYRVSLEQGSNSLGVADELAEYFSDMNDVFSIERFIINLVWTIVNVK